MKFALYHGYELSGSGSNEYTRYLARTLAQLGHDVVLICGEPEPEAFPFVQRAVAYDVPGEPRELFARESDRTGSVTLHRLPETSCYPVFLKDKQRPGRVKAFPEMTDAELREYHVAMAATLERVLRDERPSVLHANHLVYQPAVAAEVCPSLGVPFYVVPHGSSIEYTVRQDERFLEAARRGLAACDGVVWIAGEVRDRVLSLFPDLRARLEDRSAMVGVGTDTSLFTPLTPAQRRPALESLKGMHVRGGKSPALREELGRALDAGDVEVVTAYRDAYDQRLADDDLPSLLDRISPDGDVILFVGALTFGKGVQALVAAMPAILEERPDAHLVIVGSGSYREFLEGLIHSLATGNRELFDALVARGADLERSDATGPLEDVRAYATDPGRREILFRNGPRLAGRVTFLGRLDHPRLCRIFPCCRLAAFPSVIKEASPLVFFESMANGVLPMGSYHSGLRDGLDDLRAHLPPRIWERMKIPVDPAERVQGIADNVVGLLRALDTEDLSPGLRRLAEERYDWREIARRTVDAARSFIAARATLAP